MSDTTATVFNLAQALAEAANGSSIDLGDFAKVTDYQIGPVDEAPSGKSAAFTIVLTGPELNGGHFDKRRIFSVRVGQVA